MGKLKLVLFLIICISIGGFIGSRLASDKYSDAVFYENTYTSEGLIYNSQTNELFTGKFKDTTLFRIIEYSVEKGLKNGPYKYYFLNGKVALSGYMEKNKNNGEWIYFFENGQIECKGSFSDDLATDKWEWYYKDGKLKETGWYFKGEKLGSWKYFDKNGNIIMRRSFIKNFIVSEIRFEKERTS